jgi:hypothetical protein
MPPLGETHAEIVVEPFGRAEQPAHRAAARDDEARRLRIAVSQQRQQATERVDLDVA